MGFKLEKQPTLVQLTTHINNLFSSTKKETVLNDFKNELYGGFAQLDRVKQLVQYYGQEDCKDFFTTVYGWEFKEVV